jgi:hypothetical protein
LFISTTSGLTLFGKKWISLKSFSVSGLSMENISYKKQGQACSRTFSSIIVSDQIRILSLAYQKAAFWLNSQGFRNETITIHSDSQACLAALERITVKSSLVQDCIEALNLVGNCNKLHLRWVKAHVGIYGNEMADLLAKIGTTLGTGPIEDLPIPAVNLKNTIKTHFYQKWKTMRKNHTK